MVVRLVRTLCFAKLILNYVHLGNIMFLKTPYRYLGSLNI